MFDILLRLSKKEKHLNWIILLSVPKIMVLLSNILLPKLYNEIFDNVTLGGKINLLLKLLFYIMVLVIVKYFFDIFGICMVEKYKAVIVKKYGLLFWDNYYFHYNEKNLGYAEHAFDSDLIALSEFLNKYILENIICILTITVLLVLLLSVNMIMTILLFVLYPPILILVKTLTRTSKAVNMKYNKACNETYNYLYLEMSNWKQMKIRQEESLVLNTYKKYIAKTSSERKKSLALQVMLESLDYLIENFLAILLVYIVGSVFVAHGDITVGTIILFSEYYNVIVKNMGSMAKKKIEFANDELSIKRILNDITADHKYRSQIEEIFDFKNNICIREGDYNFYRNTTQLSLSINDFVVNCNEFIGILGESGSGKTTLAQFLLGNIISDSGAVFYDNYDILSIKKKHGSLTGIIDVNNHSYIYNSTVLKNLRDVKPNLGKQEIDQLKTVFNVDNNFFKKNTGVNGNMLSGGERQIFLLMRAYLSSFSIIVLDELTSALDIEKRNVVMNIIVNHWKNKTRIVITHDLNIITDADKIFHIDQNNLSIMKPAFDAAPGKRR